MAIHPRSNLCPFATVSTLKAHRLFDISQLLCLDPPVVEVKSTDLPLLVRQVARICPPTEWVSISHSLLLFLWSWPGFVHSPKPLSSPLEVTKPILEDFGVTHFFCSHDFRIQTQIFYHMNWLLVKSITYLDVNIGLIGTWLGCHDCAAIETPYQHYDMLSKNRTPSKPKGLRILRESLEIIHWFLWTILFVPIRIVPMLCCF
jgi:hypothetical protein